MPVKKYNPITPALRTRVTNSYKEITTNVPEKTLVEKLSHSGGRNHAGKMTMRQIGGGNKGQYRIIDFKRNKDGIPATVKTIEYDPNRSAFIALVSYADGEKRYIIAPNGLKVGDSIISGEGATPEIGNTMLLKDVPLGVQVCCIEMQPGKGAAIARSAGTYATLSGKEGKYASLKMPSGEVRRILLTCRVTIGVVSNPDHSLQVMGKAGANRWKGRRPRVRPVVMNPVDHPMGGGEGRASGGHPRSRKGFPAKGAKTRDKSKSSNRLIISRRKTTNK
ncbi:MAG: 50S ribosomal protein L2 [Saprospiraceae bacterium]|nr:50S ribosomal protein L2 [Saprospiraceae bacterium]